MELRDYQIQIAQDACQRLKNLGLVYIAAEVRTGKTLMALEAAKLYGAKNVLFLTKKKAISSIESDYAAMNYPYKLTVINNESLHKVDLSERFDLVISDENHRLGAFPKPSVTTKLFRRLFFDTPLIFLSGTPSPESYSQLFHQFWVSSRSPFAHYINFYKWAKDFVKVYQINYGYGLTNRYDKADEEKVRAAIAPYFITYTQAEAGFATSVKENILYVQMAPATYRMAEKLKKDLVLEGKDEAVLADTGVKLMNKCHQIYNGSVKFESGNAIWFDLSKARFIAEKFANTKIAIFYKFKQELEILREVYKENLTDDLDIFNSNQSSIIALQIQSGREGISLSAAKYLVYYNIDFSATSYWQSRDRLTTMRRTSNEVFFIFTIGGLEESIYKRVLKKKDYTTKHFLKDHGISLPEESY